MDALKEFDIQSTLYLRYTNKEVIGTILKMISYIDPTKDLLNIFDNVLNFQSYSIGTFGLNLYGILLNTYRTINIVDENYFGFEYSYLKPFNVAPFFKGIYNNPESLVMSNDNYKLLLKGIFLSSFYDGSLYSLNKILQTIFGYKGKCCILRNGINKIEIVSDFEFEDWQKGFFIQNIIPIDIGLSYSFRYIQEQELPKQTKKKRINKK